VLAGDVLGGGLCRVIVVLTVAAASAYRAK